MLNLQRPLTVSDEDWAIKEWDPEEPPSDYISPNKTCGCITDTTIFYIGRAAKQRFSVTNSRLNEEKTPRVRRPTFRYTQIEDPVVS